MTLCHEDGTVLERKVAYDQLKPYLSPRDPTFEKTEEQLHQNADAQATGFSQNNVEAQFFSFSEEVKVINIKPEEEATALKVSCGTGSSHKRQCSRKSPPKQGIPKLPVSLRGMGMNNQTINSLENTLSSGLWLTDRHIDRAQYLLANINTTLHGFQTCLLFNKSGCSGINPPLNPFIQIVNYAGNHWICLSTVNCRENELHIYDSLYRGQANALLKRQVSLIVCCYEVRVFHVFSVSIIK